MRHHLVVSLTGIAVICLLSRPAAAQEPSGAAKKTPASKTKAWTMPRTPDGKPDLQGVWNNATLTPLQRPTKGPGAGKEFFTPEEAAQFTKEELERVNGDKLNGVGNYNEFWRDRGGLAPDMRTSQIFDPPDGKIPALTPQAQKRVADQRAANRGHEFDGPENRNVQERCISVNNAGPPMTPTNYNANYQIVQSPGVVALLSEQIHDVRIIPTDGRPHVPESVRMINGDSIGHWEGNTLVVETTNFTDMTPYENSGPHMRLTERFTRTGPDSLMYEWTVYDPETFTQPWSARYPMFKLDAVHGDDVLYEYACHEGNYGMLDSLSGARAAEKAAAAGKGGPPPARAPKE
jgi:hypothetical protein